MRECFTAEVRKRISEGQSAARVVEIEATRTLRGMIERFADGVEIGDPARQSVESGCCARRGKLGLYLGVAIKHATRPLSW